MDSPYIQACPYIDASLFDGNIEVVEAILPGKSKDSILRVAHLCHPCASANDNASGVSGAMECLYAIKEAIQNKQLQPLEHSITLILVPEFTGTYCYLNEMLSKKHFLSGINLDMIGCSQHDTTGPITITNLPYASASFEDYFAQLIMQEVASLDAFTTIEHAHTSFSLRSDHSILSDPTVNIPTVMLGHWPDKRYHTSSDTINRIDKEVHTFSALIASAYVYGLANPTSIHQEELLGYIQNKQSECLAKAAIHAHDFYNTYFQTVLQKVKGFQMIIEPQTEGIIYKRVHPFPICDFYDVLVYKPEQQILYNEYKQLYPSMQKDYALPQAICEYYADGKRTLEEIVSCFICEFPTIKEEEILLISLS